MIEFFLNGSQVQAEVADTTPLLWVLRERFGLTGTKYGCGRGLCGACTVHVDGVAVRSCSVPLSLVSQKKVVTIEGLVDDVGKALKQAWIAEQVPQCGYCQSGQIMKAAELLSRSTKISGDEIRSQMSENICRCGTYRRIERAVRRAAESLG